MMSLTYLNSIILHVDNSKMIWTVSKLCLQSDKKDIQGAKMKLGRILNY